MAYFIVLEGTEGGGKSTQIHRLAERLFAYNKSINVLLTREPYKPEEIREILRKDSDPNSNAERLTNLFIKDRKNHLSEVVLPNLNKKMIVISDRYKHSTIAYQHLQGMDLNYLLGKHEDLLVPDITFILDVPVEVTLERLKGKKGFEKKFEGSKEFLIKLRNIYLKMFDILKNENIIVIDGTKSPEEVSEEIWDYVRQMMENE